MKAHPKILSSLVSACLIAPFSASTQSTSVAVEKLAYCRAPWPICNDTTNPAHSQWQQFGGPDTIQKETSIGRYTEPPRNQTPNIVYLISGQRFGDGAANLLTGQPGWSEYGRQDRVRIHPVNDL